MSVKLSQLVQYIYSGYILILATFIVLFFCFLHRMGISIECVDRVNENERKKNPGKKPVENEWKIKVLPS